jgi:hypothetical protein
MYKLILVQHRGRQKDIVVFLIQNKNTGALKMLNVGTSVASLTETQG